jgi:Holliday junction resolvasome RuvABC endonuclease subunit
LIKWGKIVVEDNDIGLRLVKIRKEVENLIVTYNINEVVIEDIQLQGNVTNNV